ncbi:MAG: hypothetical protein Q8K51_12565 [Nitrospirota bacterium]|jgi:hypothetical protein|nr:hypothetical protein [Nitrospirota bacterium]
MEKKVNCWEFKKCGRDKTNDCLAYPKGGRICYLVAGTMCGGKVQGTYAQKIGNCRECDFYNVMVVSKRV